MNTKKRWTQQEKQYLIDLVREYTNKGYPMNDAFVKMSIKVNRSYESIKNYWTQHIGDEYKEEIKNVRKNSNAIRSNNGAWTKKESILLVKSIRYCILNDKKLEVAFKHVAKQTGRTIKACHGHWYNKLSKSPNVKLIINEAKSKEEAI